VLRSPTALAALWLLSGCAHTHYYADDEGKTELPGLPFTWVDKDGKPRQAYVSTCTGFGEASFEIQRTETGGYVRFSQNLDSTAAAALANRRRRLQSPCALQTAEERPWRDATPTDARTGKRSTPST
jgi:hypothetical protein